MLHTLDFYMLTHASAVTFPFLSSLSKPLFTSLKSCPTSGPPFLSHMVFHFSLFCVLVFFILSFLPPTLSFHPHCSQLPCNFLSHNFTPNSLSLFIPIVPFLRSPCSLFSPFLSFLISSLLDACVWVYDSMYVCVWHSLNMDDEFF